MVTKKTAKPRVPTTLRQLTAQLVARVMEQSLMVVLLIATLAALIYALKSETLVTGQRFQQARDDLQEARRDAAFYRGLAFRCQLTEDSRKMLEDRLRNEK